jgi:histidine triad (HIT) family protein
VGASADCIFCRIVAGEAPCFKVHEDDLTLTFMDLYPVGQGHTLIVPRVHHESLFEMEEAPLLRVMMHSRRLARAIRKALGPDGIGVHQLNGAAAGQTVFHYHMHLIPRWHGDPIALHGRRQAEGPELAEVAAKIAAALGAADA